MTWTTLVLTLMMQPFANAGVLGRLPLPTWITARVGRIDTQALAKRSDDLSRLTYAPPGQEVGATLSAARAWADADPIRRAVIDPLIAEFETKRLEAQSADRPDLRFWAERAGEAALRRLRETTPSFEQIFAPRIARTEAQLARRWGVAIERVRELTEHALPGASAAPPRRLWQTLADDAIPVRQVLYSERRLKMLREAAALVAPELAEFMRTAGVDSAEVRRQDLARSVGAVYSHQHNVRRFGFVDESPRATAEELLPRYAAVIAGLDQINARARVLNASPLKRAVLEDVQALRYDAIDELAQLPARLNPGPELASLTWGNPRWWSASVGTWSATLERAGLGSVARMRVSAPPQAAATPRPPCEPEFTRSGIYETDLRSSRYRRHP